MVKEIEHFGAELHFDGLAKAEVTVKRKIPLDGSESSQGISRQGPLTKRVAGIWVCRRIGERSRIKRLPAWILRSKQIKRLARYYIRPNICKDAVVELEKI